MRIPFVLLLTAVSILGAPGAMHSQTELIVDTYSDDVLGAFPNGPDVGSVSYFGASSQYSVANDMGSGLNLRSIDSTESGGFAAQWFPTANPVAVDVSYRHRIDSGLVPVGIPIVEQGAIMNTAGSTDPLKVLWRQGGVVEVQGVQVSTWTLGTTYDVRFNVRCDSDQYSLWINGNLLVLSGALGFDCVNFASFTNTSSFPATVTTSFDELRVTDATPLFADNFETGDTSAWFSPPGVPGDDCTSPISFAGPTLLGDLFDNTASGVTDTCGSGNTVDEWISYTATCDGTLTVSTCSAGTDFDTIVSLWPQASCQTATELACNDDAVGAPPACDLNGNNRKSVVEFGGASAGTTYLFRVSGFNNNVGSYEISTQCTVSP